MSVDSDPVWADLMRYITSNRALESGHQPRFELRSAPPYLVGAALRIRGECARCGRPIYHFRKRRGSGYNGVYMAFTCPYDVNPGCGRSASGKSESQRIARILADKPSAPQTAPLM